MNIYVSISVIYAMYEKLFDSLKASNTFTSTQLIFLKSKKKTSL